METYTKTTQTHHTQGWPVYGDGGDFVWASSEAARRRALSLLLVGSIAGKHGGSVRVDQNTHAVSVDVPEAEKVACAREIEERVGTALN